ncbi:MAG: right-handed parallel beta-helix repeat-containing protein [bacterium]
MNNTQIYNNANGVLYTTNAKNNIMNNTQIYNNGGYGINHTTSQNQTYNNVRIYNNTTTGMFFDATSTGQKYYSTNKIFGNGVSS